MSSFPADATIHFQPFTRQADGDEVVIGRPELGVFLALPREAMQLLDQLAGGATVGEVQRRYLAETGENADLEDLLGHLEQRGFLAAAGRETIAAAAAPAPLRFHFAGIPESLARKLFSRPALLAAGALIAAAVTLAALEPALRPTWDKLLFTEHVTLMNAALMVSGLLVTLFHEMGHLTAARARGVSCRLGIGNRMWMLVAETDMTGIWALEGRRRYLPILAGPLVDALSGSLIVLVLFAQLKGFFTLPPLLFRFLQAMTVMYLLNLIWQAYFFVRTDLYYVYTTAFGCKNLMKDTQDFLRNRLARLRGRAALVDQRHIPARELKAIAVYSGFWLVGRVLAYSVFFLMLLPLTLQYIATLYQTIFASPEAGTYSYLDAVLFGLLSLGLTVVGIAMWGRDIYRNWRSHRVLANGNSPP